MFCVNASRRFLPPLAVYKAKNVYPAWIKGAPFGTRFDATKSGWFEILLPQLSGDGPFAVILDNSGCHFNVMVIKTCREKTSRPYLHQIQHTFASHWMMLFLPLSSEYGVYCWRSGTGNQGAKRLFQTSTSLYE